MKAELDQWFVFSGKKGFRRVQVKTISHILCEDYVCKLHLINKADPVVCSKSLRHFEQALPKETFVRIHHYAIVNLWHVHEVQCAGRQRHAVMSDGTALPISVRKWPAFRDAFRVHLLSVQSGTLTK